MKKLTLNLPAPLSVNRTRRVNYSAMPAIKAWKDQADALFLIQKRSILASGIITGPFEAHIVIDEKSRQDLDAGIKILIDTAVSYGVVPDDRYMRKLVIEFGRVEFGARIELTALSSAV